MLAKIAIAGVTAAAIVGAGTAALAASGSSSTNGSGTAGTSATAKHAGKHAGKHGNQQKLRVALRHSVHGSIVTKGKDGYVTHTAIRGTVGSVTSTAVTVKAADGFSQTYTLTSKTAVRERSTGSKKLTKGSVKDLKTGAKVSVLGTAPDKAGATPTATLVVDGLKK